VALAILLVPVLSGCAGAESGPSSAEARGGAIAELAGGLKREGDEAELKEIVDRETTEEERQELREGLEEGEHAEQAQEQQEQQEQVQEPEGEREQEES
jgi:hypothetical protein